MSSFTPISQTNPGIINGSDGPSASQPNCFTPVSGRKRKRSQTIGSTRKKKATDSSTGELVPVALRAKKPTNPISRSLRVSKPIAPRIARSCEETSLRDTTVGQGPSSIRYNSTCMPHSDSNSLSLPSAEISSDRGTHLQQKGLGTIADKALYHASEHPLRLKSPSPASLIFPYAGTSTISKSDTFLSSDSVELSPFRFCNLGVVATDELDTSLSGLNEYDEQQFRTLSQTDQAFEDDWATLHQELTQNGSLLALEQSDMDLSSSVKAFALNGPEFLVHDDSEMMFSGEDTLEQPTQKSDDDDFPIDDEGIEEILKLAELKQENGTATFHPVFERSPCLAGDSRNLGWLDNPSPSGRQVSKDRKALQSIAMSRLNLVSASPHISKTIPTQDPSRAELDDAGPFIPCDESFLDEDDDEYDLNLGPGGMTPPLGTTGPSSSSQHVNKSPQSVSKEPQHSTSCVQITPPSTKLHSEVPHQISFDVSGQPLPFIRPPFPAPILDRSPVQGLNSRTVLRTCFRIGEALNAATASLRSASAPDAVVELYCRSISSMRDPTSFKQTFQFGDLFSSASPPFLTGTYMMWRGIGLWDHDSRVFLGEDGKGKMARVVGKIKRLEKENGINRWEMVVMSVWEVDWEDVSVAKGIFLA